MWVLYRFQVEKDFKWETKDSKGKKTTPKYVNWHTYIFFLIYLIIAMSRGGRGQVVNVLAFNSNSPSSNPTV